MTIVSEDTTIWDVHLDTIRTIKNRIDLEHPEAKPVHSAPYTAGPAAHQIDKSEIDKMLHIGVIVKLTMGVCRRVVITKRVIRKYSMTKMGSGDRCKAFSTVR